MRDQVKAGRRQAVPIACGDLGYLTARVARHPGVHTPGVNDVDCLLARADLPEDIEGATVLDIGATNGGVAFELERRGAERVIAVDIYGADWFGFKQLKELLNSRVEYLCASVYDLPAKLNEQFDIVAFCGVLYHLRRVGRGPCSDTRPGADRDSSV